MKTRLELHEKLVELLGNKNVYYQPPTNLTMKYPCIRYKIISVDKLFADNIVYEKHMKYEIIVLSKEPDHPSIDKILELPHTSFMDTYTSDGINHTILSIIV